MSHRVQMKFTRSQAEEAWTALDLLIADEPDNEAAVAARRKIETALGKRENNL